VPAHGAAYTVSPTDARLERSDEGEWTYTPPVDANSSNVPLVLLEALPRYLTSLDPAFTRARERNEWEFLLCLLRITGSQDPGWDPFETTQWSIPRLVDVHNQIQDDVTKRHLQLWIYGHILEASAPYEMLANLIDIASGGRFLTERFKRDKRGKLPSPGRKIRTIKAAAGNAAMQSVSVPLEETWDAGLRNSIFHADYSFHRVELRTLNPPRTYPPEEVDRLVNRAIAYHQALSTLHDFHVGSYEEPKVIELPEYFSPVAGARALTIVRQGHGVVGVRALPEQVARGAIPFMLGRFSAEECALIEKDRNLALLPAREVKTR